MIEAKRNEMEIARILADIYERIPWVKIKVTSAHKFFIDRVRVSVNSKDFKEFLDTLCMKLNVEFVKLNPRMVNELNSDPETMRLLRTQSMYITNYAIMVHNERKEGDKNA